MGFFKPTWKKLLIALLLFCFIPFFGVTNCIQIPDNLSQPLCILQYPSNFISYLSQVFTKKYQYVITPDPFNPETFALFLIAFLVLYLIYCTIIYLAYK